MKFDKVKLGDYLYIKGRIGWKGLKKEEYLPHSEYRIINGESLTENGIDWNKAGFITKERYEESPEIMLQVNDILISKDGTIGKIGFVNELDKPTTVASGIFVVKNLKPEVINTRFIYHFLTSSFFKSFIIMRTEGSVIPHLYQKDFVELDFPLPEKAIQDRIVSILDSLCQKIDVNNAINDNLAEQSQAVLRLYMDTHPFHLKPLGEFALIIDCLHSKKPNSVTDTTKQLIQLNNILDTGFLDLTSKYYISESDYSNWTRKCEIVEGDCVITNVGRIGAVSQAPAGTHAAMGRNMTCVRLKEQYPYHAYLITVFLSPHIQTEIKKNTDEGTIMGALNVKNIPLLQFPFFDETNMIALEETLYPLRKSIELNYQENQKLALLRDTLLPRLMSGELDVSNVGIL